MEFNPTHRNGHFKVETIGEFVFATEPHDGIICILYRDINGKKYAKTLEDFLSIFELVESVYDKRMKEQQS